MLRSRDEPSLLLAQYLAARLGRPPPAVIAPDLEDRLSAAGVSGELSARAAGLLAGLVAARYGGPAPRDAREEVPRVVEALEACFRAREKEP